MDIKFHCDEQGNFKEGYGVRAFIYEDYSIEMHTHDFYEVNIILSGSGIHCIENGRFSVRTGDVFVIPPMIAHAYINTEGLEVYHILLQKNFLESNRGETDQVKGFIQLTEIEPFLRSSFSNAIFLHLTNSQLLQLKTDIDIIDDGSIFCWQDFSVMKYHTIWKILYWFSALLDMRLRSNQRKTEHKYELQIIKVLEFIHYHYDEKITIDKLCNMVYLSRSTLIRSFKEICGLSPIEYLNNYRAKKAQELLDLTMYSKTEIAHKCGFYDLSHMERILKTHL